MTNAEPADQRARRNDAIQYLIAINTAQARSQSESGAFVSLGDIQGLPSTPVGFIPKLLHDQWSYVISLKDYFDACGFALFSDERGVITSNGGSRPRFSSDGRSLWCFSPTSQAGAARGQINVVPVTTAPFAVGVPSVVLVEDPSNGISLTSFDVAKDGRLLMTRRADPQPGDEARVVLMQNRLAARPPKSINRQ